MRAGDHVHHLPSNEHWTLSTDPENGYVTWYGWPEGEAKESDCVLIEACSDDDHRKALEEWGARDHRRDDGGSDLRHVRAKRQLADLNQSYIGAGL